MENNEISLESIFHTLWRRLPLILAVMLLFGAASWAYSTFMITPKYTTSAIMIAISNTERTTGYYTSSEHNAAVALVNTTSEVIKTNAILDEVSEQLAAQGLNYSAEKLKSMITITSENETEVFRVKITGTRKEDLAIIANTVAAIAEERVGEIMQGGSTTILEEAGQVTKASPNEMRNAILGALVGAVLTSLILVLRDINDSTIWTEEDLTSHFDTPVLGLIPQLSTAENAAKKE